MDSGLQEQMGWQESASQEEGANQEICGGNQSRTLMLSFPERRAYRAAG
jgi:hypothetical protein